MVRLITQLLEGGIAADCAPLPCKEIGVPAWAGLSIAARRGARLGRAGREQTDQPRPAAAWVGARLARFR